MISPLTPSELPAFTAACAFERIFGSRVLTALRLWGLEGEAEFFLCRRDGDPAAALCLENGVLTVAADGRVDPAEIAQLVRDRRAAEVDTDYALCAGLHAVLGGELDTCDFMAYRGAPIPEDGLVMRPAQLPAVFGVLQRSHEYYRTHLKYTPWAADWQRRLDAGLSELYQLELDGQTVGAGGISSEDDACGVIASVAVVPEYRNRGLGSSITRYLARRIQAKGKTPCLVAGYEGVARLYRGLGFEAVGCWGELYL